MVIASSQNSLQNNPWDGELNKFATSVEKDLEDLVKEEGSLCSQL